MDTFFYLGFLNGFLPCGLVYMAVFASVAVSDLLNSSAYMVIFGLGTIPLMTLVIYAKDFIQKIIINYMQMPNKKNQNSLNRTQKEAICLLSIGTFLEYFDLMLYVHLAVLLNDLFFPQSDPTTKYLLSATAFSMTFILRPVGGFVIGRIGDAFGRKVTII